MKDSATLALAEARIIRLEEALAEYAMHYGPTERTRALFREGASKDGATGPQHEAKPESTMIGPLR